MMLKWVADTGTSKLNSTGKMIWKAVDGGMQGREHEWLFSQPEGQEEVSASCQAKRLIIVSCKRGQTYGTTLEVQQELSPMVGATPLSVMMLAETPCCAA